MYGSGTITENWRLNCQKRHDGQLAIMAETKTTARAGGARTGKRVSDAVNGMKNES